MVNAFTPATLYESGGYLRQNPDWHGRRAPWKAKHIAELLARNDLQPRSLFDIGCGTGLVAHELALLLDHVDSAVGFEPSSDAPAVLPTDSIVSIRHQQFQHSTGKAELGMLIDVIEHVDDYFSLIRSTSERVNNLVLHIPLELTMNAAARPSLLHKTRTAVGHIHTFSRSTALWALEDAGLTVLDYTITKAAFEGPDRRATSPNVFVRKALDKVCPTFLERSLGGYSMMVLATKIPTIGKNSSNPSSRTRS